MPPLPGCCEWRCTFNCPERGYGSITMSKFPIRALGFAVLSFACAFSAQTSFAQSAPIRSIGAQTKVVEVRRPGQMYQVPSNTVLIRSVSGSRDKVMASNQPISLPARAVKAQEPSVMASALQDAMGRLAEPASLADPASSPPAEITAGMVSRMENLAAASKQQQSGVVRIGIDRPMELRQYRPHPYKPIKTGRLYSLTNYQEIIQRASQRHGVEEALVRSVIHAESSYNPKARSPVGAGGLMQLMPATAARFGVTDRFDPAQNIDAGTRYLAWLLKRYRGNVTLASAAYNAGEGAVDRYKGVPPYRETKGYVVKVGSLLSRYRAVLSGSLDEAVSQMRESPGFKVAYQPAYAQGVRKITGNR